MNNTTTATEWGPIGEDVYRRTYSRQQADGTYETWQDTVARVVAGSTSVGKVNPGEVESLTELIGSFKMLPAGRHLWITGTGLPYTRNCFRAPWSSRLADHFEFMADQLLTGGGVGANYSQEYISQAPILKHFDLFITCDETHPDFIAVKHAAGDYYVDGFTVADQGIRMLKVEDKREGWAAGWGALFDAATSGTGPVALDLSNIRQAGAEIKTFGGTASGPAPFVESLVKVCDVLNSAVGEALRCNAAARDRHPRRW